MGAIANGPNSPVPCPVSPLDYFPGLQPLGKSGIERSEIQDQAHNSAAWAKKILGQFLQDKGGLEPIRIDISSGGLFESLFAGIYIGGTRLAAIEVRALIVLMLTSGSYLQSPREACRFSKISEFLSIPESSNGYVYFLHGVGTRFYKIGHSNNLDRRIKEISPKLPFSLDLVHSIWTDDRRELEAWLHRKFDLKRKEGEWFELDESDLDFCKRLGESFNSQDLFLMCNQEIKAQGNLELDRRSDWEPLAQKGGKT